MGLNADKTKIMLIKKSKKGRKKKAISKEWEWLGKEIEKVDKFNYLGYMMTSDNSDEEHIKTQVGKARAVMGKIWGIGEKLCKEDWVRRMMIFKTLVKSIIFYGEEVWGYKECEEVEKVKKIYVKWVLGLKRSTPDYITRRETKEGKIWEEAVFRILKYEEKLEGLSIEDIRKQIWLRKK